MSLQSLQVLLRFMCREFGYSDIAAMLRDLHRAPDNLELGNESEYSRALYINSAEARISPDQFSSYDTNIIAHSRQLRMMLEYGRMWKPHQYLALLFTEHYLHRYFEDAERLRLDLNRQRLKDPIHQTLPEYTPDGLRTVAFQSATGSGKTLLMHAHILQYRYWLNWAGKKLNNVILLTPNEQLSAQHERELRASGLHARLFSNEAGTDLFTPVEIIDLNKLAEKKGIKRVAVQEFGENNLVLVDEGHLGTSGKVWRERRGELSRGGFTFEYSATFNQVAKSDEFRQTYGKCLLFDYPYREFHQHGYGKDYAILNLPEGMQDTNSLTYLLGCLLTFYQQHCIWKDKAHLWADFQLTRPLWVFLGKTVIGSNSQKDRTTGSDIAVILDFLGWVLSHEDEIRHRADQLLSGTSGLTDVSGNEYFAGHFDYLKEKFGQKENSGNLYDDICAALFHGRGRLHVAYLTAGEGELHLRCADNPVFGVVNVGDSSTLYKMLTQNDHPDLDINREQGFAERLFHSVDRPDSSINIVVGARRFIAGWNSWRVSTMGLMHVGVNEGPEIIQMFGRGVRLKGWNMSLKRHTRSNAPLPNDHAGLEELEKLYIFGLRANYMQTFRGLLSKDGIENSEKTTIRLPTTWNFARQTDLKLLRLKENRKYEISEERPVLPDPSNTAVPRISLNLYSKLQAMTSGNAANDQSRGETVTQIPPRYISLFNRTRIYDKLLARKQQKKWHNLAIMPETVDRLLEANDWYDLYIPRERISATSFEQVQYLENVAIDLITEYTEQFWRRLRRKWEYQNMEVIKLSAEDRNNIKEYQLTVNADETRLIEHIRSLKEEISARDYHDLKFGAILAKSHAYQPLLYATRPASGDGDERRVTIQPVPLNENEEKVVKGLEKLARENDSCLQGKELFLIRNLTRGRGVSFFDDYKYYPDFIVWLKERDHQHVLFLDPKGLARYSDKTAQKVQLHREIREVEKRIRKTDPNLHLHAYVLSVTKQEEILAGTRSTDEWKQEGVYFLSDPDCLQQVITDALANSGNL